MNNLRGSKKSKEKAYVPEALEHFGRCLISIRHSNTSSANKFGESQIKLDSLQEAVKSLPKADREEIEKFWGLTGGPIHSKKIIHFGTKDIAYREMRDRAIKALKTLLTLDYVIQYDLTVNAKVNLIARKINQEGLEISDIECIKYLSAFFAYLENGPKMSFEEDAMSIDTDLNGNVTFDECVILSQIHEEVSKYPDNSINMKLLISFIEMLDFKDMLTIKKSIGIEIPEDSLPDEFTLKDLETIEIVKSVSGVRALKERIFPYGAWEVATALILGNESEKINLDNFMEGLELIRKDWANVGKFKIAEMSLKTATGVRKLNVYDIGGLKFTDIYEVMFLYLERNLIAPEL